jgi:hypothetical protein
MAVTILWNPVHASENLQPGNQYKIIGPVYIAAIYNDLRNKKLNRQLAIGELAAVRYGGPEVAFQHAVQPGTIMTIIGPIPTDSFFDRFFPNRYYIKLDTVELAGGLDVVLWLNRGVEGDLDGLTPELFSRVNQSAPSIETPSASQSKNTLPAQNLPDTRNLNESLQ